MAAKKKVRVSPPQFPPEDRRAEAATVAWMLCALFTLCAEGVGLAARMLLAYSGEVQAPSALALLPDIMLVMGLVTGTIVLALTAAVYKLRKTPPPPAITVVAILLGLTPWVRVMLGYLR